MLLFLNTVMFIPYNFKICPKFSGTKLELGVKYLLRYQVRNKILLKTKLGTKCSDTKSSYSGTKFTQLVLIENQELPDYRHEIYQFSPNLIFNRL